MRAIAIVDYDPIWPALFASRSAEIGELIGMHAVFHHIGSTAVPGLCAKPKLDIDAVLSANALDGAIERIKSGGFRFHGDLHRSGRWCFTKDDLPYGTRLYLCAFGNSGHRDRIQFRDYLRADPEAAVAYAALKHRLAAEADGDFEHYTCGKTAFVMATLERAQTQEGPAVCSEAF